MSKSENQILEILEDIGIHPEFWNGTPRDRYGDGWNDAVKEITRRFVSIIEKGEIL